MLGKDLILWFVIFPRKYVCDLKTRPEKNLVSSLHELYLNPNRNKNKMFTFIRSHSKVSFLRHQVQRHERLPVAICHFSNLRCFSSSTDVSTLKEAYEYVLVEKRSGTREGDGVGLITLNRPKAFNALCDDLFSVSTCIRLAHLVRTHFDRYLTQAILFLIGFNSCM